MAGAWEVKKVQWCHCFQRQYGNSVVCATTALHSTDPSDRVCVCWMTSSVKRGVTLTLNIWVSILKKGFLKTQPCCQPDPRDFDLLMNCFIDLHLSLLILKMPTILPALHPPNFVLFLILCREEVITGCYCMCDLNLQACHLFPPPLLWCLFLSQANLYCGNLRQLSSAQWCKRTNLMPPLPHSKVSPLPHSPILGRLWPTTILLYIYFPVPPWPSLPCEDNNGFVWTIPALQVAYYCVLPVLTQQVQALCLCPFHRLSALIHNGGVTPWHMVHKDMWPFSYMHKDSRLYKTCTTYGGSIMVLGFSMSYYWAKNFLPFVQKMCSLWLLGHTVPWLCTNNTILYQKCHLYAKWALCLDQKVWILQD